MFSKSKWIWLAEGETEDQYVEFTDTVVYDGSSKVSIALSVDSNYTLYVNGNLVDAGQYADFEHYKIYDTVELTPFLQAGENRLLILAYHSGYKNGSRYQYGKAGLIFEVQNEQGELLSYSSPSTLSRPSPAYVSGRCVLVTSQLGYTFLYDANKENEGDFVPSATVEKPYALFPRPIKKSKIGERRAMKTVTKIDDCHYLIDLGGEAVGVASLELCSEVAQTVTVAWGEHLLDGGVRKELGNRHFSYQYRTCVGENRFDDYMLHLGCRYIEVFSEAPIELIYAGIRPDVYQTNPRPYRLECEQDQRIYDVCLNTLNLCMMDHYVDCPWREQGLYTCDSRNQMLFGYYAFADKNAPYARANLKLIGEDRRDDNLLSICYPCSLGLAIPSFSLYYLIEMKEYLEHTGDTTLAAEYFPKLCSIINVFLNNRKDGLAQTFADKKYWNFYEWTPHAKGKIGASDQPEPDLILNALLILALDSLHAMANAIGKESPYPAKLTNELRQTAHDYFYTPSGLFTLRRGQDQYTSLCNSLAILAGIATAEETGVICRAITDGKLDECSLSMKVMEYDALLSADADKYRAYILNDIRSIYQPMLDFGSDTVWETAMGADDFGGAGSLCHAWSSIPIYIYHKFGMVTESSQKTNQN